MLSRLKTMAARTTAAKNLPSQKKKGEADPRPQKAPEKAAGKAAQPSAAETAPFHFKVSEEGEVLFERGFQPGEYLIGASLEADIVIPELGEDEMASLHLERSGSGTGLIRLNALDEGVRARGRKLESGETSIFPSRAAFHIESFDFSVEYVAPSNGLVLPGAGPVLLIAGALLAGSAAYLTSRTGEGQDYARTSPSLTNPLNGSGEAPQTPQQRLANAETDLKSRLIASNLSPPLTVSRERATLVVTGTVTADERARVSEIISSFRQRIAVPIELVLSSDPDPAQFIVGVALKPETYILGRDGRRYTLRQRLPDGGLIEAIDATSVLIDRDGLKERVIYAK
jgi:hypothetical protein